MRVWDILAGLNKALRSFAAERRGNVAITFAIATLPIIGAVGAAVDYSRANSVKAAMQSALDSTALMLSRDAATLSASDLQTKASNYFNAMFIRPDATSLTLTATYTAANGSEVIVNGAARVPTTLMAIAGYNYINVTGTSTAKWGTERLRVALALDNTGSMAWDGKMTALKSATKSLLTQLKSAAKTNGDVYVSIVPFSKDVNIGNSNYSQSYIDWTSFDENEGSCSKDTRRREYSKTGCANVRGTWTATPHSSWNGCITDRGNASAPGATAGWDQVVTAPNGTSASKWPAEDYDYCPVAMKGLSYDWTTMNSLVDAMYSSGNTNQPIGLVWAWQSLTGGGPLTAPAKDPNYNYKEIIILMSDGLNTADRWYTAQTPVDNRMYQTGNGSGTCANIKAAGITIYSIQVDTGGDGLSTVMQNCASSADRFYRITQANDLVSVFSAIGTDLTKLRVAK